MRLVCQAWFLIRHVAVINVNPNFLLATFGQCDFGLDALKPAKDELQNLRRRLRLIYLAVASAVFCALFVGLLIIVAFIDALLSVNLAKFVGMLFVLAMSAFIASLVVFLREIFLAVAHTRKYMP